MKIRLLFFFILLTLKLYPQALDVNVLNIPDSSYTWDLSDAFANNMVWDSTFTAFEKKLKLYKDYKGHLADSPEILLAFLDFDTQTKVTFDQLSTFAFLRYCVELNNPVYTSMYGRTNELDSKIKLEKSYVNNEIMRISDKTIQSFCASNPKLKIYEHYLNTISINKTHSLIDEKEEVVAQTQPLSAIPKYSYEQLTELDFNELGKTNNQTDLYDEHKQSLASLFEGHILINKFNARLRNFNTVLEASLFPEKIPEEVYSNIINTVGTHTDPLKRWVDLLCKIRGKQTVTITEIMNRSVFDTVKLKFNYVDACNIIYKSQILLGKEYAYELEYAILHKWIDVYPSPIKINQTFTGFMMQHHPYVVLNWDSSYTCMRPFAHETGHVVNTTLCNKAQPMIYGTAANFNAETPANVSEILLYEYMIKHAHTNDEKLLVLEDYIKKIIRTLYIQSLLAELEKKAYDFSETGQALTYDLLEKKTVSLFKQYFGDKLEINNTVYNYWSLIPHMYLTYYVYKYPVGMITGFKFVDNINNKGDAGVKNYIDFLKAGSSEYPFYSLKKNGVDLTSSSSITPLINKLNSLVDEVEVIVNERAKK